MAAHYRPASPAPRPTPADFARADTARIGPTQGHQPLSDSRRQYRCRASSSQKTHIPARVKLDGAIGKLNWSSIALRNAPHRFGQIASSRRPQTDVGCRQPRIDLDYDILRAV